MLSIIIIDILGLLCLILIGTSIYFFNKYRELKKENKLGQKKKVIIKEKNDVEKWGWDNAPTLDEIAEDNDNLSKNLPYGEYVVREVEIKDDNDLLGF